MSPSKETAGKKASKKPPKEKEVTQEELIKEFFIKNPDRDIAHPEVVDWLTTTYRRRTSKVFRDPDRGIRKLSQKRFLRKVAKGVYRYDSKRHEPGYEPSYFTEAQKKEVLRRGGYRCIMCTRGVREGVELHVDHVKPLDDGGESTLENAQILCAACNFRKKNYGQTETFKRGFIRLYKKAISIGDVKMVDFTAEILEVYEKHGINGHIKWEGSKKG